MGEGEKPPNKDPLSPLTRDKVEHGSKGGANRATQIGDPSSLKAETVDKNPTEEDGGSAKTDPENQQDSTGPSSRSKSSTSTEQTPTGKGNSKTVGGSSPPSSLQTPPSNENKTQNKTQGDRPHLRGPTDDERGRVKIGNRSENSKL